MALRTLAHRESGGSAGSGVDNSRLVAVESGLATVETGLVVVENKVEDLGDVARQGLAMATKTNGSVASLVEALQRQPPATQPHVPPPAPFHGGGGALGVMPPTIPPRLLM
ncbi:unnamed protein product, partial [Pylaiella littoralis]